MSELELYYVDALDPDLDKLKYFIRLNNRISNMRSNLYLTSLPTYNIFILLLDHLLDKDIYSNEIFSLLKFLLLLMIISHLLISCQRYIQRVLLLTD